MISMQLRSLWKYFSGNIIVALYPIHTEERMKQFLHLIFILLSIQLIVFSSVILIATGQFLHILIIMIVGLLGIKFIIVPKRSKEFPHFNEKNYLKSQGENKLSPWPFYFSSSNKNHQHNQCIMIFTYKNHNTCLRPNKKGIY